MLLWLFGRVRWHVGGGEVPEGCFCVLPPGTVPEISLLSDPTGKAKGPRRTASMVELIEKGHGGRPSGKAEAGNVKARANGKRSCHLQ